MSESDYCDLCDLPRSQCVHGMPAPAAPAPRSSTPRTAQAPRAPRTSRPKPAVASRPVNRRWTPPDAIKPVIVEVLADAGGQLEADAVMTALQDALGEQLKDADHEHTPEGEPRWQLAARKARQALIGEGVMTKSRPGVWELSDR